MSRDPVLQMRVASRRQVADAVVALVLESVDPSVDLPPWGPGAHVDLVSDGDRVRQYSLCGRADETKSWQVAVLRVPDGRGGSAWVHDELREGVELVVRGPRNHFELESADDYLFIAGGIGITPILAMIRQVDAAGHRWRLAYGGRSRSTMAFLDELAAYGERVQVYPEDEQGLMDLPSILGSPRPGRRVYSCGPEPLLQAVEKSLDGRPETLHVERFAPRLQKSSGPDAAFEVEIASTGRAVQVAPDESIIDALQTAGLEVDFSCREGTCGTCETGVLGGIPEHRDSVLTDEEREANDCMMICVGRCVTGPLLLDL